MRSFEPGEIFKLVFKSEPQQTSLSETKWYRKNKRKCLQEFKTSDPSAHIAVSISNMDIPSCDDNCR